MQKKIYTHSPQETEAVGAELARGVHSPAFIALYGDLGVGKTAFVRGFASVFCENTVVRSPTFSLVNEYRGKSKSLLHFDMYRITDEDDLYSIGYDDYLARDAIILTEWSENIPFALPECYIEVVIEKDDFTSPDSRLIRITQKEVPLC